MHEEQDAQPNPIVAQTNPEAAPAAGLVHLSTAQELALEKLASGASIPNAAKAAGVDRKTVYRWLQSDPHFAAAFNTWRAERVASNRARALAMSDLALDTVSAAMEQGNARVALQVAKATGALKPDRPGPTDPEELRRRRELREGRQEMALAKAEQQFRKESGDDDQDHYKDVGWLETLIDSLIDLRAYALKDETPEARAARLSAADHKPYPLKHPETGQLLALIDAAAANKALPGLILSDSPQALQSDPSPASSTRPDQADSQAPASASAAPPPSSLASPSNAPDPSASTTIKTTATRVTGSPPPAARSPQPPAPPRRRPLSPFYTSNDSDDEIADPAWTRIT
jgi:hypothetical protein